MTFSLPPGVHLFGYVPFPPRQPAFVYWAAFHVAHPAGAASIGSKSSLIQATFGSPEIYGVKFNCYHSSTMCEC